MIIGVAGFGILAIFSMIVVEKTRDIGILKSLGASNGGVMSIFLGYGLLLGVVGCGPRNGPRPYHHRANQRDRKMAQSGHGARSYFPRNVYYFDKIPTDIDAVNVVFVNFGAIGIAVLFSVLPAFAPQCCIRCSAAL